MLIKLNCKFSEDLELHPDNPRKLTMDSIRYAAEVLLKEEFQELCAAIKDNNQREIIDGAMDCAVVALNIAYKLFRHLGDTPGVAEEKTEESFRRVIESNFTKLPVSFRADGKIQKGSSFKPPVFDDLFI